MRVFVDRLAKLRVAKSEQEFLVFDKDDEDALDFVAATSNLRAQCFHIPRESRFRIKGRKSRISVFMFDHSYL